MEAERGKRRPPLQVGTKDRRLCASAVEAAGRVQGACQRASTREQVGSTLVDGRSFQQHVSSN